MAYTLKLFDASCWDEVVKLFMSNRECGLCFCMNHRRKQEDEVLGEDARKEMKKLLDQNRVCSVLAYDGDDCVGWCAVDPLSEQPGHDYSYWKDGRKEEGLWSIHCLFIHADHRGKGLSNMLIEKAVETAKNKGAKEVIAFPIPPKMRHHFPEHDGEFSGRYNSYIKAGFKPEARINDFYEVLTKRL